MEIVSALLVVALLAREWAYRKEMREERLINAKQTQDLLQRIQAPSVAVMSHATPEDYHSPNPVPAMEDEEIWKVLNAPAGESIWE